MSRLEHPILELPVGNQLDQLQETVERVRALVQDGEALAAVVKLDELLNAAPAVQQGLVDVARANASWARIAKALGLKRAQSAYHRFAVVDDRPRGKGPTQIDLPGTTGSGAADVLGISWPTTKKRAAEGLIFVAQLIRGKDGEPLVGAGKSNVRYFPDGVDARTAATELGWPLNKVRSEMAQGPNPRNPGEFIYFPDLQRGLEAGMRLRIPGGQVPSWAERWTAHE